MTWKVKEKVNQRLEFVKRVIEGEKISALCKEYEISRVTGHCWLNRYRESKTINSLFDRSHKPESSPNQISNKLEGKICNLRKKYGWGGRKLQYILEKEKINISIATINRVIKRNGLLVKEDCHRPALQRFERCNPNELWQADFKGPMGRDNAQCEPLSIIDDHSRYVVGLVAVKNKQTPEVKKAFTQIFEKYGVPEAILVDHGVPWWSTSNFLGISKFSVWLMKQDLKLIYSAVNHPQTQGKVERFHRSLALSVFTKGTPRKFCEWKSLLRKIKSEFNNIRPHEALGMNVPKSRYVPSSKQFNPKPSPIEYPSGSKVIRLDSKGRFKYKNTRRFVSQALAGEYVMIEELEYSTVVYYRKSIVRELYQNGSSSFVCPPGSWSHSPPWGL